MLSIQISVIQTDGTLAYSRLAKTNESQSTRPARTGICLVVDGSHGRQWRPADRESRGMPTDFACLHRRPLPWCVSLLLVVPVVAIGLASCPAGLGIRPVLALVLAGMLAVDVLE